MPGEKSGGGAAPWTAPLTSGENRAAPRSATLIQRKEVQSDAAKLCPCKGTEEGHLLTSPLLAGQPPSFGHEGLPLGIISSFQTILNCYYC
ncbi:hypothetical protein Q7C36_009729 [Tachysurus vachellii]|uniref:Uncharacterized protein n=1 Tax=Tachysurus vachellii TaxID=175792 RepID=A0AA88MZT2_TACVA|nr:hypothetical protein Q7C36_009729 [Tachysurus vachellii]